MLLVEDCKTTRRYIEKVLQGYQNIELLPSATDGLEAIHRAVELAPDVILSDLQLPRVDGVEAIATIMAEKPCPIVVLSGELSRRDNDMTFEALNAGAVKVIAKPRGLAQGARDSFADQLVDTLRLMSQVQVVTGRSPAARGLAASSEVVQQRPEVDSRQIEAIAVGASTGGPAAIYEILSALEAPLPVPMFIAQHITEGFEHGLCRWLRTTGHRVEIPLPGDRIEQQTVYLSPANASMVIGPNNIEIDPPVGNEITPNINRLFRSLAQFCRHRSVGVLLTGMGSDGAAGLGQIYTTGGWTIAQARSEAVIDSMPAAAIETGVVHEEMKLASIVTRIQRLTASGE